MARLTPDWQWHDHGNAPDRPMIWLDGLDVPTVRLFEASLAEWLHSPAKSEAIPAGDSLRRYRRNLRSMCGTAADRRPAHQPLLHYPYAEWRESLPAWQQWSHRTRISAMPWNS
jgi:gentisate 1,2-dioxygenase